MSMYFNLAIFTLTYFATLGHCLKGDYTDNPPPSLIPYLPPEPNGNEDPPEVLTAVIAPAASAHESYYGQPNYQHPRPPPAPMPYLGPPNGHSNENIPRYRDESPQPLYHAVPHIELPPLTHPSPVGSYENNEINHQEPPPQASPPIGPPHHHSQPPPPQELYVAANSPYDHTHGGGGESHQPPHYGPPGNGHGDGGDEGAKYQPYVPSIESIVPTSDGHIQNADPSHHSHHPLYASAQVAPGESLIDHESHSHHSHEAIDPHHYSHHEDHHGKNEEEEHHPPAAPVAVYSHHHHDHLPHHEDEHHHSHHSHHSHKHSESSSYSHKSSDHPGAKSSIYHSQDSYGNYNFGHETHTLKGDGDFRYEKKSGALTEGGYGYSTHDGNVKAHFYRHLPPAPHHEHHNHLETHDHGHHHHHHHQHQHHHGHHEPSHHGYDEHHPYTGTGDGDPGHGHSFHHRSLGEEDESTEDKAGKAAKAKAKK